MASMAGLGWEVGLRGSFVERGLADAVCGHLRIWLMALPHSGVSTAGNYPVARSCRAGLTKDAPLALRAGSSD